MEVNALRDYLVENRPLLECWGKYVKSRISQLVASTSVSVQMNSSRAKEIESAVGKVARKGYHDPLNQMTDLVGVRFVVLVSPELSVIGELIETNADWTYTKDRDPDEEAEANAEKFGYQSLHYIVRSRQKFVFEGTLIPEGLPCEVQIRTLLQHAYAEVVHDSIYKAVGKVPPKASRFVARSMALIETTDHLFCETMSLLEEENKVRNQLYTGLADLYSSKIGQTEIGPDEKLNLAVLEAYMDSLPVNSAGEVSSFCDSNSFVISKIRSRLNTDPFWSQPVALLAYWLVSQDHYQVFDKWPFASSHDALRTVYSDLGISLQ